MWTYSAAAAAILLLASLLRAQTAELPPGPVRQKATTQCTECHSAAIIVQQRLSKTSWTKEVDKMVKWGALVDVADRDALIEYLSSNFPADKPAYVPPRNLAAKRK
jgi:hypothetical protein